MDGKLKRAVISDNEVFSLKVSKTIMALEVKSLRVYVLVWDVTLEVPPGHLHTEIHGDKSEYKDEESKKECS